MPLSEIGDEIGESVYWLGLKKPAQDLPSSLKLDAKILAELQ